MEGLRGACGLRLSHRSRGRIVAVGDCQWLVLGIFYPSVRNTSSRFGGGQSREAVEAETPWCLALSRVSRFVPSLPLSRHRWTVVARLPMGGQQGGGGALVLHRGARRGGAEAPLHQHAQAKVTRSSLSSSTKQPRQAFATWLSPHSYPWGSSTSSSSPSASRVRSPLAPSSPS